MLFDDQPSPHLVGIARLAAASDLLEAKKRVEYLELETRRFIGRGSGRMRSIYTINPYRGCEFGCKYCYARYAHEFMELRDPELFERKIYAKRFHAAGFRDEVRRLKTGETIWIGTATDPYQPAERRFRITRGILEAFAGERGFTIGITTKSDLVARDAELLAGIARKNSVSVHLTITTLDEALARILEPRAPRPELRVAAVRKLTDAGVRVGVLAHPMMPLINDSEKSIEAVCAAAVASGACSFSANPLFLKPCAQQVFFPFLEQHFPHLLRRYKERYQANAYLKGHYPELIQERVQKILSRHKLPHRDAPEWPLGDQLELFPPPTPHDPPASTLHRKVDRV
ncbi:MAG TPA: radical SAM protein [Bryobacteraceae bacterium]|jgi:DNA repair photolyase|nr:radical SAM protein [Bryobacteraceae bacterium]